MLFPNNKRTVFVRWSVRGGSLSIFGGAMSVEASEGSKSIQKGSDVDVASLVYTCITLNVRFLLF